MVEDPRTGDAGEPGNDRSFRTSSCFRDLRKSAEFPSRELATNRFQGSLSNAGIVEVASSFLFEVALPVHGCTSRRVRMEATEFSLSRSPLNDNVFPLHVPKIAQTLPECLDAGRENGSGGNLEILSEGPSSAAAPRL